MRAVVQRVTQASVTVDGELLGRIGKGFLILLGVADGDTRQMAEKMADKICRLRIFEDENGKTNLSLEDVEGELLVVSQFTCTRTAARATAQALSRQARPRWRSPCTNILWRGAGPMWMWWRRDGLEQT